MGESAVSVNLNNLKENQSVNFESSNIYQQMDERPIKGMNQHQMLEEYGQPDAHPQPMKKIKQPRPPSQDKQIGNNSMADDERPLTGTNKDFK